MDLSKEKLVGRYGRKAKRIRKNPTIKVPESGLQKQIEDTLDAYHVKYVHIEDSFWSWFNAGYANNLPKNVPPEIYYPFVEMFAGMPDIVSWIRINDNFNLSWTPELKTLKGILKKKQKKWASEISVPILRTTEENVNGVVSFIKEAEKLILLQKDKK